MGVRTSGGKLPRPRTVVDVWPAPYQTVRHAVESRNYIHHQGSSMLRYVVLAALRVMFGWSHETTLTEVV